jgi:transposase
MPIKECIKHFYEKEGLSIREISRRLNINWRTAAKYAREDNWNQKKGRTGRPGRIMGQVADIVDSWLMEDSLKPRKERRTAAAIYRQLKGEYGFQGSERSVRRYVALRKRELKEEAQEKYLKLEHIPGEAQVDFGTTHVVWEGKLKEIKYLVLTFPYSNAGFSVPVPSENTQCFLHALITIFEHIGGVPQRIVFDNLSAAVVSIGQGEKRTLTEAFRRFVLHYHFQAEFCNPGKGNEKGNVENKVGYARRNWFLPYLAAESYEELTKELFARAQADMERPHYEKGISIAELFTDDRKALLPLPTVPFEPFELTSARVDKYLQVRFNRETYAVPAAQPGEQVLLKLWWDKVEVLDRNGKHLALLPRSYTVKAQPIDWKGYFAIFVRKPRGARHTAMYRFLPSAVRDFLERGEAVRYRERLKFIFTLLQEEQSLETIARAISEANSYDPALIRHQLYRFHAPQSPPELLREEHTPPSVREYNPSVAVYDRLLPQREEVKGDALSSPERAL